GRPVAAPRLDAVEALGVAARVVVDFQALVAADLEPVRDRAHRDAVLDDPLALEVLVRQFETMVPELELPGPEFLDLLPREDPVFRAIAAGHLFEENLARLGQVGVALRRVSHDQLVTARAMLEEVVDALLLHEPAGEGEVALAVLHAVVSGVERA